MIVAGDIGGTKSLLALYEPGGNPRSPVVQKEFPSRDYPGLAEVLTEFLTAEKAAASYACFGLPGPIVGTRFTTPNLPWEIEFGAVQAALGAKLEFINDLEATGYGIPTLRPEELRTLHEGQPNPHGNAALIAPGTGLGECILFWDGEQHRPSASEGGHCDFAPRTPEQIEFLRWAFETKMPRISFDRVASGTGLPLVYEFVATQSKTPELEVIAQAIASAEDPAPKISKLAMEGKSALCEKALDMWVAVLGAEAGNLALKALATAGVYLGGGIPPKILPKLEDGTFLTAFLDKGRLAEVVSRMPVQIILNDDTALYGAARYALRARRTPRE